MRHIGLNAGLGAGVDGGETLEVDEGLGEGGANDVV
jgi:hypothetical protein